MKKFSNLLIFIGILVFLIPVIGKLYTNYEQNQLYEKYLANGSKVQQSYESLEQTLVLPSDVSTESAIATPPAVVEPAYQPVVLGRVKIPKIDESLLLVEGVQSKDLKVGAGHMPGTAMPGEIGNCAIAGHRNYTFGSYFNRLDEVAIGDKITVEYGKKSFTYEVYEILVVLPEDTSVLNYNDKDQLLTLITCTPVRVATHRLIVHAKII